MWGAEKEFLLIKPVRIEAKVEWKQDEVEVEVKLK